MIVDVPPHVVGRRVVFAAGVGELDEAAGEFAHQISPGAPRGRVR